MPAASYPNFAGKHEHEGIFSPTEVVAGLTANGSVLVPDAVVLTYQPFLLDELRGRGVQPTTGYPGPWRSLWFTGGGACTIAVVGGFGIGAPAATTFTVGRYRGVDVASAFVISDHLLAEDRWTHAFGTLTLRQASIRLLDAALHALSGQELSTR